MNSNYLPIPKDFSTRSIHSGKNKENDSYFCLVPPIVTSVNFKVDYSLIGDASSNKYKYTRLAHPSRDDLQNRLAALEGAKYGLCFSSGCGNLSSLLGIIKPGSHIICSDSIFGGTYELLSNVANSFNFKTSFINIYDLEILKQALEPNTALIWIEPISNPLMNVADIKKISKLAHDHNILLVVDNTILTPYFHRPLELGADIVSYSLTKYLNGHCDVLMGALLTNDKNIYEKLNSIQTVMGVVPSPFDCSQVVRSLKTLPLRMKQHNLNATKVAHFLDAHPKILKVIHPGFPCHPQHELFKRQTSGHSGVISFYIDGDMKQATQLLNNFKIITPTTSFGSIESIAEMPLLMSQAPVPESQRNPNITGNLIRLSVGLEDIEDIINDIEQALNKL